MSTVLARKRTRTTTERDLTSSSVQKETVQLIMIQYNASRNCYVIKNTYFFIIILLHKNKIILKAEILPSVEII